VVGWGQGVVAARVEIVRSGGVVEDQLWRRGRRLDRCEPCRRAPRGAQSEEVRLRRVSVQQKPRKFGLPAGWEVPMIASCAQFAVGQTVGLQDEAPSKTLLPQQRVQPRASNVTRVAFGVPKLAMPYLAICSVALRRLDRLVTTSSHRPKR
jgi:hypothetical protein